MGILHTIVCHGVPWHFDDHVAAVEAIHFGSDTFGLTRNATLRPVTEQELQEFRSLNAFLAVGILPIGVGDNSPLNDHVAPREERKEGVSAATLMAKYLGLDRCPELSEFLRFTRKTDEKRAQVWHDLSAVTKTLGLSNDLRAVFTFVETAVLAIVAAEKEGLDWRRLDLRAFDQAAAAWIKTRFTGTTSSQTSHNMRPSVSAMLVRIFTLAQMTRWEADRIHRYSVLHIAALLKHRGEPLLNWLTPVFDTQFNREVALKQGSDAFAESGRVIPISEYGSGRTLEICAITSDEQLVHEAARMGKPNVCAVIVKRTDGHAQIFFQRIRVSPDQQTAMVEAVRSAELRKQGRDPKEFNGQLTKFGDDPSGCWHRIGEMVLNGSRSVPHAPVTQLSLEEIVAAVTRDIIGEVIERK